MLYVFSGKRLQEVIGKLSYEGHIDFTQDRFFTEAVTVTNEHVKLCFNMLGLTMSADDWYEYTFFGDAALTIVMNWGNRK